MLELRVMVGSRSLGGMNCSESRDAWRDTLGCGMRRLFS